MFQFEVLPPQDHDKNKVELEVTVLPEKTELPPPLIVSPGQKKRIGKQLHGGIIIGYVQ